MGSIKASDKVRDPLELVRSTLEAKDKTVPDDVFHDPHRMVLDTTDHLDERSLGCPETRNSLRF